ncbi:MAG TPA: GcrA family cell cycle regulator, partial [Hyphomicrobiaceae bacterium]|nr:GcrA family cell cycle regulator [Hyphomicrobiaceae bacterium]
MAWTDERVELLKKLWSEGLSASQIAGRLGGVTRNAVIGKVHRLGLSGRATTSRMKTHRPRPRVAATTKRLAKPRFTSVETSPLRALYAPDAEPYVPSVEELVIPLSERRTIQT